MYNNNITQFSSHSHVTTRSQLASSIDIDHLILLLLGFGSGRLSEVASQPGEQSLDLAPGVGHVSMVTRSSASSPVARTLIVVAAEDVSELFSDERNKQNAYVHKADAKQQRDHVTEEDDLALGVATAGHEVESHVLHGYCHGHPDDTEEQENDDNSTHGFGHTPPTVNTHVLGHLHTQVHTHTGEL